MKKIIGIILAAAMVFSTAGAIGDSLCRAYGDDSLAAFTENIGEMLGEYGMRCPESKTGAKKYSAKGSSASAAGFETGRVIVKSEYKLDPLDSVSSFFGRGVSVFQFSSSISARKACDYYNSLSCVEYAEPDVIKTLTSLVIESGDDEPYLPNGHFSWGSEVTGSAEVIDYLESCGDDFAQVNIGIIDTGIDYNNIYLKDRLIDKGRNFSLTGEPDSAIDDDADFHGTHVAGIAADNSPEWVKLKGYKIFDSNEEADTLYIAAAVETAVRDGMDVLNLSYGGPYSKFEEEAYISAYQNGTVLVSGAGNDGVELTDDLPGGYENVITVAAAGKNLKPASWSNYGRAVDITAPGVGIKSCVQNNSFDEYSGTSMAVPFVSSAAAILLSVNPDMTPAQVEKALVSSAVEIPYPSTNNYVGGGMVNIAEALDVPRTKNAEITVSGGVYHSPVTVGFDKKAGTEIYYTVNGTMPTRDSGLLYSGEFTVGEFTDVRWVTYGENEFRSTTSSEKFRIIYSESEDYFTIDTHGTLLGYSGTHTDISVPETVGGVTVTSVAKGAFDSDSASELIGITLPETVKTIEKEAFYGNSKLKFIGGAGVEMIDDKAFHSCAALEKALFPKAVYLGSHAFYWCRMLENLDISSVEEMEDYAVAYVQRISSLELDSLRTAGDSAFLKSSVKTASFPKLEQVGESLFSGCASLETLYLPKAGTVGRNAFSGCSALEYIYFCALEELGSLPPSDCSLILTESLGDVPAAPDYSAVPRFTVFAPEKSYAREWAEDEHSLYETVYRAVKKSEKQIEADAESGVISVAASPEDADYIWFGIGENGDELISKGSYSAIISPNDGYSGYYCVIISRENGTAAVSVTETVYPEIASADYSRLDALLASVPEELSLSYTDETASRLTAAVKKAESLGRELTASDQSKIDECCREISEALNGLKELPWIIRLFRRIIAFFKKVFSSI